MGVPALSVDRVIDLNATVREVAANAGAMADAAQRIAAAMHDAWTGDVAPLVRLYVTVRFRDLPSPLQEFALRTHAAALGPDVPCLTLLGTQGVEPAWCAAEASVGHRAIPLVSPSAVRERIPMVAGLLDQLNVEIAAVVDLKPEDALVLHHREYGIFHVQDPAGSDLIPAKDFVSRYQIRSVVGCGGALPSGELFTAVAFMRVRLDEREAALFRTIAYGIKAALVPYTYRVFG